MLAMIAGQTPLDTIGGDTLERSPHVLAQLGRIVSIVDIAQPQNLIEAWGRNASYHFVFTRQNRGKLDELATLVARGQLKPHVGKVYPLAGIPDAQRAHKMSPELTDRVFDTNLRGPWTLSCAVARALMKCGVADLYVFDLNQERAHELAQKIMESHASIRCHVITDLNGEFAGANVQGIVNATPVGMAKLPGLPFPVDLITPEIWVIDIIYFPIETELLRSARSVGCKTMGGDSMAVFQAVRAYELFTKRAANPAQMRAAFSSFDAQIPNQTLMNEEGGI